MDRCAGSYSPPSELQKTARVLRPAQLDPSVIGQPLPWDLFTESGVLVAGQGLVVADEAHFVRLLERPLFCKSEPMQGASGLPEQLAGQVARADALLNKPDGPIDPGTLANVVHGLRALYQQDGDFCLGYPRLAPLARPSVLHCAQTLFTALFLADQMELKDQEKHSLAGAALTMNLADLDLHDRLGSQPAPLGKEEKLQLAGHPARAAERLAGIGLDDLDWLETVIQHHENMDGSGYPARLSAGGIRLAARILRVADTYCARLSKRHYTPPKSGHISLTEFLGRETGRLDSQIATLLLRRIGLFPPGTLVRLASREHACVTRRWRNGIVHYAVSFMDARGRRLDPPQERDLTTRAHLLRGVLEKEAGWPPIDWKRLWGY